MATGNAINANATGLLKSNGAGSITGVTTTQYGALVGAASNGITSVALTSGQLLIGGTTAPVAAGLTGSSNISITPGSGSIAIDTIQDISTSDSPSFTAVTAATINSTKTKIYSYKLSMEDNTTYVVTGMSVRGSFILQACGASNGGATAMFFGNDSSEYNAGTVTKQTGATKGDGTNGLTMTWPGNYGYPSISQDEGSTKAYNISYWKNSVS